MKVRCEKTIARQVLNLARGIAMTNVPVIKPYALDIFDASGSSVCNLLNVSSDYDYVSESTADIIVNLIDVSYYGDCIDVVEYDAGIGVLTIGELLSGSGICCDDPDAVVATVLQPCKILIKFSCNVQDADPDPGDFSVSWKTRRCAVHLFNWEKTLETDSYVEYDLIYTCDQGYEEIILGEIADKLSPKLITIL